MKIGIVVYSQTGNTLSVAQKLYDRNTTCGNQVSILKVTAFNEQEGELSKIGLKDIPDIENFDALIFGSPVHGFSLAPVMMAYLLQLPTLSDKKVACFVTQGLPKAWMGGNRSLKQMVDICTKKGAKIESKGIVNWPKPEKRAEMIQGLIEKFRFIDESI